MSLSKKKRSRILHNNDEVKEEDVEIDTHKKYTYLQKEDKKLLVN